VMRQVNTRTKTPIPATLLIFAGGILLMVVMPGKALLPLITAGTIMPVLIYAATVILYLSVRRKLGRQEGAFDLGRFELPIAISALVWLAAATFVLVTPGAARIPVLIVVGLMLVGAVFFVGMLLFDRKALDSEPEALAVAVH
jgi:amino acid transporter